MNLKPELRLFIFVNFEKLNYFNQKNNLTCPIYSNVVGTCIYTILTVVSLLCTQNQRRIQLLTEAVKAHSNYTDDAISGRAIDRHLMGLRVLARDNGIPMPDIFTDTTYGKSLHFQLSTSQV